MNTLVNTAMSQAEVGKFIARLKLAGYKPEQFEAGWACELDGRQLFRATNMGNEHFAVRYCERTFPDV